MSIVVGLSKLVTGEITRGEISASVETLDYSIAFLLLLLIVSSAIQQRRD